MTTKQAEALALAYLSNNRQITIGDLMRGTGLPQIEGQEALQNLMGRYDCRLKVSEQGDLIYDFGRLQRRGHLSMRERWAILGQKIWRGFKAFYRWFIAFTLVLYFVVFGVLLIAFVLAALSSDKDSKLPVGDLFLILARMFLAIFEWNTVMGSQVERRVDARGYGYRHYKEKPSVLAQRKKGSKTGAEDKSFVASIYDFVFGPPRVETDNRANARELAAFVRLHQGLICIEEVQAMTGMSRSEAGNFLTECLANFNGKADVSASATLYADFEDLVRGKIKTQAGEVVYYWDEYEAPYELTGNTAGKNALIILMNVFNLGFATYVLANGLGSETPWWVHLSLGWLPLLYSLVFFALPIFRYWVNLPSERKRYERNVRKRLYKVIFQEHTAMVSEAKLIEVANAKRTTEEPLNQALVNKIMREVIDDLGGEAELDANNELIYRFDNLDRALQDVEALRGEKKSGFDDLGEIVFEA